MNERIKHLVMYSGGICSYLAAKRVIEKHGTKGVYLLFADTKIEDEDLYRFLEESSSKLGVELIRLADGRTPWEVMRDERIIGNSRIDPCSKILKRELLNDWRFACCDPNYTITYTGMDWTEGDRISRHAERSKPWRVEAPMSEPPFLLKNQMMELVKQDSLTPPRLYYLGFPHNNCGGFCIKAGQSHFALLLKTMPERYNFHENKEEEMRSIVGDHSILKERVNGVTKPLTLRELRLRIEANHTPSLFDWGGCGCAVE